MERGIEAGQEVDEERDVVVGPRKASLASSLSWSDVAASALSCAPCVVSSSTWPLRPVARRTFQQTARFEQASCPTTRLSSSSTAMGPCEAAEVIPLGSYYIMVSRFPESTRVQLEPEPAIGWEALGSVAQPGRAAERGIRLERRGCIAAHQACARGKFGSGAAGPVGSNCCGRRP